MPHFKCVGCRTRLCSAARPADLVGDLCPGCGSPLEPVGKLAEIVGFQSITHRHGAVDDSPPRRPERIGGRVDALFARREALLAQARRDAGRSVDDGGSATPEAMAEAVALPTPADLDGRRR
jgi:hypothetical protein